MEYSELLIDTSVIIEHLRKTDKRRSILYGIPNLTEFFVSSVTVFELQACATIGGTQSAEKAPLLVRLSPVVRRTGWVSLPYQ